MKAILPVAGVGSRLRPHTYTLPKALINVAGKPIVGHILDSLEQVDVDEVVLIIGYMGEKIVDYVQKNHSVSVSFVEQKERKGLGHAIYLAKNAISRDEPLLIILGDTIVEADLKGLISTGYTTLGVKEVPNPRDFGVVEMEDGFIKRLVEKPEVPPSHLAIVGLYYIKNAGFLFDSLDEIIAKDIKVKGEYQLTDGLQLMLDRGEKMMPFSIDRWHDCGNPQTLLMANKMILDSTGGYAPQLEGSIIIPPVYISPSSEVKSSIIGPYASVADGAVIEESIVRSSIVNEGAVVKDVLLADSLIGEYAEVKGDFYRLNIGDSSEMKIVG